MRIGLSTSVMQRGHSGVGQYVLALVRALLVEADRHEFTLFVLEQDLPLFAFTAGAMNLVSVPERFRPPVRNVLWHQFHLPRLARRHQLDVLHVPSYRRLLWQRPCPLIATIHDLAPFRVPGKYNLPRMLYGRLVVPRLARRQDQIIAVSQFTAGDIDTFFGIPRGRLRVIHNGMDRERFHPGQRAAAKADLARSRDLHRPFFLYVARLEHPAKNHARLVAAFNGFKSESGLPWQLVLAGSDWNGAEVVHRLIRESPFARDIHTLGFVSEEELPTLYRAADLFVFPSLFEGFGMPPVEAMACGCPVLSSRRGALAEVVGDAAASFDPESVTDLRRQMTRLAVNLPARNDLRAKGLARAAQFDWHSTAASTLEVYASAAAGSRRRLPIQTRAPEPLSWIPEDATLRPPPDRA